jgi:D-arabinose 1-dehydrogenase-like Zn-dependent alcohol dehydrogenase
VLLCSIGTAQWLELRRHVPRAGRWVTATAAAWCAGLVAFSAVTSPLWQPGQRPALVAAIGALGGLVMALTVAVGTGWALVRLLRIAQADQVGVAITADPRSRSDQPWKNAW